MQKPKAIDKIKEDQPGKQAEAQGGPTSRGANPLAWKEAWEDAHTKVQKRHHMGNKGMEKHIQVHPMGAEMLAIDVIFQIWALVLEVWHLSRSRGGGGAVAPTHRQRLYRADQMGHSEATGRSRPY